MDDWSQYATAVDKRWPYYAPRFERFARGEWVSWNWAAFVATLAWLRYRKLYAWSWVYFFASTPFLLAVLIVVFAGDPCERALDPMPSTVAGLTIGALLGLGWILPPLLANRLYFNHVRRLIGKTANPPGTSGFIGALTLQALVLIGAAAAVPSYAFYTYRMMVLETILTASAAREPLQSYVNERGRLPGRIDEVAANVSGKYLDRLVLESDGTIRAILGEKARKLSGHSVSFVPEKKDGRIVGWVCRSSDLPNQCLPAGCRRPSTR